MSGMFFLRHTVYVWVLLCVRRHTTDNVLAEENSADFEKLLKQLDFSQTFVRTYYSLKFHWNFDFTTQFDEPVKQRQYRFSVYSLGCTHLNPKGKRGPEPSILWDPTFI